MVKAIINMQKQTKYIISFFGYSVLFLFIYFMLDYLSGGYRPMINDYGIYLVVINIVVNIFMALISGLMLNFSTALVALTKKKEVLSYTSFISVILGFFTYGCTSCMITFLGAIGISFGVYALPLHNLGYKLLGLAILILAFVIQLIVIKRTKCKI